MSVTFRYQARIQKCEIGGGANDESGGAAGRAPKARDENRRGSRRRRRQGGWVWGGGVPSPMGKRFWEWAWYAAFWVQSDAFSDITRSVLYYIVLYQIAYTHSHSLQIAQISFSLSVPHWVRDAGYFKEFFTGGEKRLKGQAGCEGHRRHCIWKEFRFQTTGPDIRIGGSKSIQ